MRARVSISTLPAIDYWYCAEYKPGPVLQLVISGNQVSLFHEWNGQNGSLGRRGKGFLCGRIQASARPELVRWGRFASSFPSKPCRHPEAGGWAGARRPSGSMCRITRSYCVVEICPSPPFRNSRRPGGRTVFQSRRQSSGCRRGNGCSPLVGRQGLSCGFWRDLMATGLRPKPTQTAVGLPERCSARTWG